MGDIKHGPSFFATFKSMKRSYLYQIIAWLAYLLLESYIEFLSIAPELTDHSFAGIAWIAFFSELSTIPVKVALVYSLIHIIFPTAGRTNPWWQTALVATLVWTVAVVLRRITILYFASPFIFGSTSKDQPLLTIGLAYYSVFELFPVVGIAIALKAYHQRIDWREREKNLVNEKLKSEINFLKAQINPHFLFNTLNNIYALARKQSPKTPDAVLKLSKLLRFMLYDAHKDRILLLDEVKLIEDYIELQKLRYTEKHVVNLSSTSDDNSQQIAPLLLIHFVENAFKHGTGESRVQSTVTINLHLVNGVLYASFFNTIDEGMDDSPSVKIGLTNIKRQLELLYPRHTMEVKQERLSYSVELNIDLRQYEKY
jgi:two-component system, LytTR family, sensor kinase